MLVYVFFTLTILAAWHLVFEAVLAPAARMTLRNELFYLRDSLRRLKIDKRVGAKDEELFAYIHDGLNVFLNRLSQLHLLEYLVKHRALSGDEHAKIRNRVKAIENCSNDEMKQIFQKANMVLVKAFLINLGAWGIYLVPIFLVAIFLQYIRKSIRELLLAPPQIAKSFFRDRSIGVT